MTTKTVKEVGELQYDCQLTVSYCSNFFENLERRDTTVSKLYNAFSRFKITDETYYAYSTADKKQKTRYKDVGGIIAGSLVNYFARSDDNEVNEGRPQYNKTYMNRYDGNVKDRTAVMLDFDECGETNPFDAYRAKFDMSACMYSTHSSTPSELRVRLFVPLSRPVNREEYQAVTRYIAGEVGIDIVDECSFKWCQLMFLPSAPLDVEPIFDFIDAPICNPDEILERYGGDWRDPSKWAYTPKEREQRIPERKVPERRTVPLPGNHAPAAFPEPLELSAERGAFNKVYFPIQTAIEKFLSDVYRPTGNARIYALIDSESAPGLKITDDDMKAYSFHSKRDIAADGQKKDAYELVMYHLFGTDDEAVRKMNELVRNDKDCQPYLLQEEEERERLLEQYRVDLRRKYPNPESAVTINDTPVITLGNLQSVKAKAKNGKTMFLSVIMSALIKGECLGIKRLTDDDTKVIFFDNEQHVNTTANVVKRVHYLCGLSMEENDERLITYCLTPMEVEKRLNFIVEAIRRERPKVAFVDGIADLIWDINDLVLSEKCVDSLYKVAQECNTAILCVLHENKADSNMRGHLGTILLKSGTDTFEVKRIDKSQDFQVIHTETRFKPAADFYFTVDEHGVPCEYSGEPEDKQQKMKDEIYSNVQLIFSGKSQIRYNDLCTEYMEIAGCSERTAKNHISKALHWEFLKNYSGYYSRI